VRTMRAPGPSRWSAASLVALATGGVLCTTCDRRVGGLDANLDVPDAPIDIALDCETPYEFVLEPGPTERCPPWDLVPHPTTTLSLAPVGEPYVVWEWSPVDDPIIDSAVARQYGTDISGAGLGPDGSLWVITPESTAVVVIDHDGQTRWAQQYVLPGLRNHTVEGPITVAPDGTGFFDRGYVLGATVPAEVGVLHVDREGLAFERRVRESSFTGETGRQFLAVAPDGVVYYESATESDGTSWLVRSCAGSTDAYEWRLGVRYPSNPGLQALTGTADHEGGLIASFTAVGAVVRVSPRGDVSWLTAPLPYDAERSYYARALAEGTILFFDGDYSYGTQALGGEVLWRSPPAFELMFDPLARMWTATDTGWRVLDRTGNDVVSIREGDFGERRVFSADGSALVARGRTVRRIDGATGEIAWSLDVGLPTDGAQILALDVDGRLYVAISGLGVTDFWGTVQRVVAIQTDVVAPRNVCVVNNGQRCNRHNNSSLYDYGPVY